MSATLAEQIDRWLPPRRDDEPGDLRQQIADELADHLACSAERQMLAGMDANEAEAWAREQFGDVAAVARQLWWDAMKERIMKDRVLTGGVIVMAAVCLAALGFVWSVSRDAQQANAQIQAQLERIAQAAAQPVPAEWNRLSVRLLDAAGEPIVGRRVRLHGRLVDHDRTTERHEVTDDQGIADFGTIRIGEHLVDTGDEAIDGWYHQGPIRTDPMVREQVLTLRPPSVRREAIVRVTVDWPEVLRDRDVTLRYQLSWRLRPSEHPARGWVPSRRDDSSIALGPGDGERTVAMPAAGEYSVRMIFAFKGSDAPTDETALAMRRPERESRYVADLDKRNRWELPVPENLVDSLLRGLDRQ